MMKESHLRGTTLTLAGENDFPQIHTGLLKYLKNINFDDTEKCSRQESRS
jgi:hypothetical protein